MTTYFPELKVRSRWNAAIAGWWRHRDDLMAVLDEQIAATRADPGLADREDILALLVRARDEDGRGLGDAASATSWWPSSPPATRRRGRDRLGRRAARRRRRRSRPRGAGRPRRRRRCLDALVKEVLRIARHCRAPPAASRAVRVGGHPPPGTAIIVDGPGCTTTPPCSPSPTRCDPSASSTAHPSRYSWLPFGGGAHRCIGAALAELEIKVALSTMLRRVDLGPATRDPAPAVRRGLTMVPFGGGRVRVVGVGGRRGQAPVAVGTP